MRFVLAIPYAYLCSSSMVSSQKETPLRGKDNIRLRKAGNIKVCTLKGQSYIYFFSSLEINFFDLSKKSFLQKKYQ